MKILYLTNHLNIGGISSYCLSLATGMKKRGHDVYIASSGGERLNNFISEGIQYIPIPIKTKSEISPKILLSMFRLKSIIKKNGITIVHANSRTTQVLGYLLQKAAGVTYVSTCHGFFKPRFSRRVFPCWGLRTIAISESVEEHLVRDFGLKRENVKVVYNGIDLERFREKSREMVAEIKNSLGLGPGPVIGIVARLSDVKGHIYLIRAMEKIIQILPQAQLLIVGEGKIKNELLALSQDLGIKDKVFFVPSFNDTSGILSAMDVFVMPSLKEGLGLALMEAMACGLAVVGSGVGGIKNLIRDRYNGILVEPADSNALSKAISELLQNQEKRKILGKAAQLFISQNFSQEKMTLETERLYQECLSVKN